MIEFHAHPMASLIVGRVNIQLSANGIFVCHSGVMLGVNVRDLHVVELASNCVEQTVV
jgi:hypothetical protein